MKNLKRILAILCIALLVALYIVTLVLSVLDVPGAGKMFLASAFCTIMLPIMLYIYMWIYKLLKNKEKDNL